MASAKKSGGGAGAGGGAGVKGDYDLETKLMAALAGRPQGVTNDELKASFGSDYKRLVPVMQHYIDSHRIEALKDETGYMYRLLSEQEAGKYRGLTSQDMLVYQRIEVAGDRGIWTRNLKSMTGLAPQVMNKILKKLQRQRLIKQVKDKNYNKRKMFMLADITPSKELTGGTMYTSDTMELDKEFINMLRTVTLKTLRRSHMTRIALSKRIQTSGITPVQLSPDDMQQVIDALVHDGKVERVPDPMRPLDTVDDNEVKYRLCRTVSVPSHLTSMPCGICPVASDCSPDGVINPNSCVYMTKWLDMF